MLAFLFSIAVFSWIILRWPFFFHRGIPSIALISVLILKSIAGYISYQYHSIYFAGGDGAIYLNGGYDLVSYSGGNPIRFLELFFNLNRGIPEWEKIYTQIIYWDSNSSFNFINDNRNAIRINAIVSLFSFKNIGIHIIILNFLSLIGLNAFFIVFERWFQHVRSFLIFIAVFLSPSIIFWTSGILKETHSILFIGLFLLSLDKLLVKISLKTLSFLILSVFLLVLVRSFFAFTTLIAFTYFLLAHRLKFSSSKKLYLSLFAYLGLLFAIIYAFDLHLILAQKQEAFILIGQKANSYFTIPLIERAFDLLLNLPGSLINVSLQPQLFSFESFLYIFPIIENIDIVFLLITLTIYRKKIPSSSLLFLLFISLVYLFYAALIGWTVPIQGAISRYRSIGQPFLLMALFSLLDWDKIQLKYLNFKKS